VTSTVLAALNESRSLSVMVSVRVRRIWLLSKSSASIGFDLTAWTS
jgi:hypothetical protein